jgi:hypothetical protein
MACRGSRGETRFVRQTTAKPLYVARVSFRSARRLWLPLVLGLACFAVVPRARADAKTEATAKGLETKAMQEDYLATDFDKALEKLNKAQSQCGADKCSSMLRAQIKRDIGIVQIAGKQSHDAGVAAFVDALKADPGVQLDPDTKTKEIEAAWAEAKKQAGPGPAASPTAGDFVLTPPPAQQVHTPLPVYVEYTGNEQLAKVVAKYKAFGMTEWKSLELKKLDKGWGAEIPCADVQQGDLLYYVQGFNAANDPVATSGDRNNPFKTAIAKEPPAEAPHLPGAEPPKQCAESGDCPPDFPGCKQPVPPPAGEEPAPTGKAEGEDCETDDECQSNKCRASKCTAPESKASKRPKLWIGIAGQLDFVSLPSSQDVCLLAQSALPLNGQGYYCTDSKGTDVPSRSDPTENNAIVKGTSDKVQGGLAPGNIRVLLTVDYAFTVNFMAGIRLGYVLNTYPGTAGSNEGKTFAPIHAELRGTYVFGKDALAKAGLAPYAMVAGGVSEWDSQVAVTVVEAGTNGVKNAQAWNMSGPAFGSVGGGLRFAFSPRMAAMFGPRVNMAFGSNGSLLSLSPELGLQYGF